MTIHERYIELIKKSLNFCLPNPKVFKCDCWNESKKENSPAEIFEDLSCIDVDKDRVKEAKKNYPKIKANIGDIRNIKYEDNSFDLLLDLSTLDHVTDYENALDEYKRITTEDGILLIISWVSFDSENVVISIENQNNDSQLYHLFSDVESEIKKRFKILEEGVAIGDNIYGLYDRNPQQKVFYFICKNKK